MLFWNSNEFFIQKVINQFVFRNCFKKTFISSEYHHNQIISGTFWKEGSYSLVINILEIRLLISVICQEVYGKHSEIVLP